MEISASTIAVMFRSCN